MKNFLHSYILDPLKAIPIIFFYGIAWMLPLDLSSYIFGKIARFIGPFLKVHTLGIKNLHLAFPEKSAQEIHAILRGVWENLGRIAGEFPHINHVMKNPHRITVVNQQNLENLVKSKKPILFMAGHLGNWEIPHHVVIQHNCPIGLISRPPNNFIIKKLFDLVRAHPLTTIFFKGSEGSRQIMHHLKNGGALGVLFDQRISDGEALPLFNHPALTATGPAKLAKKYGALMIPVQVERIDHKAQFQITFHDPIDTTGTPQEIMTTLNKLLEGWIRQAPEQWLWLHKRWKLH